MIAVSFKTTEYWCPVFTQIIIFASASMVSLSPHLKLTTNNKKKEEEEEENTLLHL